MTFDSRDELWNASYDTYYDAYYFEIITDKIITKWLKFDKFTKLLVSATASGSAISGWALWNDPKFKFAWVVLAGIGALLSIIHTNLQVSDRLKDWSDSKRRFAGLRIDLETFRYRMIFNPEFSVDDFSKEFVQYRKIFGEAMQDNKNDILWSKNLEKTAQNDLNRKLLIT